MTAMDHVVTVTCEQCGRSVHIDNAVKNDWSGNWYCGRCAEEASQYA